MSLFAAYEKTKPEDVISDHESQNWLCNASFANLSTKPIVTISSDSSDDDSVEILPTETEKKKEKNPESEKARILSRREKDNIKRKHSKTKIDVKREKEENGLYFVDTFKDLSYFKIDTLHSRARPLYDLSDKCLGFVGAKKIKKEAVQRYHAINIDYVERKKKNVIKRQKVKHQEEEPLPAFCTNIEEEMKLKTQEFNEILEKEPENVETWIEFIKFQEDLGKFQKLKTSSKGQISIYQKQLSIADKALNKNSDSSKLLKIKLQLMSEIMPADDFSNVLESLLNKNSANPIYWQFLLMTIKSSVVFCNVPKVLEIYSRCLNVFRQKLRSNPVVHDSQILGILYETLMFLRHAGYWEQMWETIRMNLSLNLDIPRDNLKKQSAIDEKKIIDMEEVILTSGLPLNQLWLRVESLRERCHWVSVEKSQLEFIGDSKRFVLAEDVADFVHPLLSSGSNFTMATYFLLSLKVPLLPSRSNTLKSLQLDQFKWSQDSLEIITPMAYPFVGEMAGRKKRESLLTELLEHQLTSGPQYLRFHPAQEAYLDFIRTAFHSIAETLNPRQRTGIYVWWLRFERLLVFLGKSDPLKIDKNKKLKILVKDFLKKLENRNNLHFYREYALIERELGKTESCLKILETSVQSQILLRDEDQQSALFSVFRALFETLLDSENYHELNIDRVLKSISQMVPGNSEESKLGNVETFLADGVKRFLNHEASRDLENDYFMPNLDCDRIACYAFFLYTKKKPISEIVSLYDLCIEHAEKGSNLQEQLYESKVSILQLHSEKTRDGRDILVKTVKAALEDFENNFYFLTIDAEAKCELPFWKLGINKEEIRLWKALAMCLVYRARIRDLRNREMFTSANAMRNKTLSFYKTLTKDPETRYCPLVWRLYMLLVREEHLEERKGEHIYHESMMHCPWARNVYIDAAEIAPQLLMQIQDVIREKELRMHVTPEELNILRG